MPNDLDFLNNPRFSLAVGVTGDVISAVSSLPVRQSLPTIEVGGAIPAATALALKLCLSAGNVELRALLVGVSASGSEQ